MFMLCCKGDPPFRIFGESCNFVLTRGDGEGFCNSNFFVKKTLLEIAQNAKQTFVKMSAFFGEGGRENGIFANFPYGGEGGGLVGWDKIPIFP